MLVRLIFLFLLVITFTACESSSQKQHTMTIEVVGLGDQIGVGTADGKQYFFEGTDDFSPEFSLRVNQKIVDESGLIVTSHPEGQYCYIDPVQTEINRDTSTYKIFCDTVSQLDGVQEVDVGQGVTCVLMDNRLHCWGDFIPLDERLVRAHVNGQWLATGTFVNPRLLQATGREVCLVDDNGLYCSHIPQERLASINAATSSIKELAFDHFTVCYIDDNGVTCDSLTDDSLVNTPKSLVAPHSLTVSKFANFACVIDQGKPICWGGLAELFSFANENYEGITVNGLGYCAFSHSSVDCQFGVVGAVFELAIGEQQRLSNTNGFVDFDNSLVEITQVATNENYGCALSSSGTTCWGIIEAGFYAASDLSSQPKELVLSDGHGCLLEPISDEINTLICFGDDIFEAVSIPESLQ